MAKEKVEKQDGEEVNQSQSEIKYVEMVRDAEIYPEPHTATVHPDEVDNYAQGGWKRAD